MGRERTYQMLAVVSELHDSSNLYLFLILAVASSQIYGGLLSPLATAEDQEAASCPAGCKGVAFTCGTDDPTSPPPECSDSGGSIYRFRVATSAGDRSLMVMFSPVSQTAATAAAAAALTARIENCALDPAYYYDMLAFLGCVEPPHASPPLTRGKMAVVWHNGLRATYTSAVFKNVQIPHPDGSDPLDVTVVALPAV